MQIEEYEIELESLTNKLKEQEHTFKNLLTSAEEKDSLIDKLKSALMSMNGSEPSAQNNQEDDLLCKSPQSDEFERDLVRKRKMDGLLKLIQEKNQQIDSLRVEVNELRSSRGANSGSMSDLNSSFTNSLSNQNNGTQHHKNGSSSSSTSSFHVKMVLESLEKEIQIYQKLNSNKNVDLSKNLDEIIGLRNELIKQTVLRDSHGSLDNKEANSKRFSSSSDHLNCLNDEAVNKTKTVLSFLSPRSGGMDWRKDSLPDSGLVSQKSDATINSISTTGSSMPGVTPSKRSSFIPRPISSPNAPTPTLRNTRSSSFCNSNSNKIADLTYKNHTRDELIQLIQQIKNENLIFKRQQESKFDENIFCFNMNFLRKFFFVKNVS